MSRRDARAPSGRRGQRWGREADLHFELAGQGAQGSGGLFTDLRLQQALPLLILAQGGCRLARSHQQTYQVVVRLLSQWIRADRLAGVAQRGREVALPLKIGEENGNRVKAETGQALLLRSDPLLVVAGQKPPLVQIHGPLKAMPTFGGAFRLVRFAYGGLKSGDVGSNHRGDEAHGVSVGAQNRPGGGSGWLELVPQGRERRAEVVARGLRAALRPEDVDEDLAGVHLARVIGKICEEAADFLVLEARDDPVFELRAQSAEQGDAPRFGHGLAAS